MKIEKWKYIDRDSTNWNIRFNFWRFELQFTTYRHRYPENPNVLNKKYIHGDRWVFKPHLIFDRKIRKVK